MRDQRKSLTPEQYCLNMSMLAARQRLRELNYTESMINPSNDAELETEVRAAPWNTSKAVLKSQIGREYLDFKAHLIDPTGPQREGFSCVPWPKSTTEEQLLKSSDSSSRPKTPSEPFNIDPTISIKIKKEKLQRLAIYQREAQLIADIQNDVLKSTEVLSSDDDMDEELEENDALDASFDEQLSALDRMVVDGQSSQQVRFEREEQERQEMVKEFCQNRSLPIPTKNKSPTKSDSSNNIAAFQGKILKITRTYDSTEGQIQRTEIVREPKIIALYVKQKGGSLSNSQNIPSQNTSTPMMKKTLPNNRRGSLTLGPTELCRADGCVVTISKSVLNMGNFRRRPRLNTTR